ncbi:UDP-N-acetylglucosamine--N-acetylmuramyl-(pentapeptide) pyrophosphoryl-undecaprenol N-acetylglucosamine transferase [Pedobacter sp.]|nr:UDP-N-acetylglucosamine--N-acetylmuramyl-(pentapeptide) pyrophosphoryl-undecaprenol N-acetylglucosamine transferase [Candidatus Saccharibacteria bacterium]
MRILTVGGGSGGHVTPVLAVINELSRLDPHLEVMFVCDKAFESQSRGLMKHAAIPVAIKTITAGKFRRYHGESRLDRLLDVSTISRNIVDVFKVMIGFFQSVYRIIVFRPSVIFAKGGYVCLPMGMAAKVCGVPLVVHDSDARPGLTNRVLSRWATSIGTGSPLANYPYNHAISQYVGVPIDPHFHPYSDEEKQAAKLAIGVIDSTKPLLVVTGGGLGATSINKAVISIADQLIAAGFEIYHVTGKKHFDAVSAKAPHHAAYHGVPFVFKEMDIVLGAADIVISRASATFIQELAALQKPVILIPAKQLGDQIKNALVYQEADAAVVLSDEAIATPKVLLKAIQALRSDTAAAEAMAQRLHVFAKPDAALDVAGLIVKAVSQQGRA